MLKQVPKFTRLWLESLFSEDFDKDSASRAIDLAERQEDFEIHISKSRIESVISSGRRMRYESQISIPVTKPEIWQKFYTNLGQQPALVNAMVSNFTETELIRSIEGLEQELLPKGQLKTDCSCPNPAPYCNHVLTTIGQASLVFSDQPFEFLLFRGKSSREIRQQISDVYSDLFSESVSLQFLQTQTLGELPEPLDVSDKATPISPWQSKPADESLFTLESLLLLAEAAADKANKTLHQDTK